MTARAQHLAVAVLLAVLFASSVYLYWLATTAAGMPWWLALTLPVALDAGGGVAAYAWVRGTGRVRIWGQVDAAVSLVVSAGANVLGHFAHLGWLGLTPLVVAGVAVIYPARLWTTVHLVLLMRAQADAEEQAAEHAKVERAEEVERERRAEAGAEAARVERDAERRRAERDAEVRLVEARAEQERQAAERARLVVEQPATNHQSTNQATSQQGNQDELVALVDQARPLMPAGRAVVARELGCSDHKARQVLAALKEERQLRAVREVAG